MLNLSKNSISKKISLEQFPSYQMVRRDRYKNLTKNLIYLCLASLMIILFLPWTQNIQSKGQVTTRNPEQRPQAIQSVIEGRLENWYVKEGDHVEAGDTIAFLSEIKNDYFDPLYTQRTQEQIQAKEESVESYTRKASFINQQILALQKARDIKINQTQNEIRQIKNKISADSAEYIAAVANLNIAKNQLLRIKELHEKGLKSLSELQEKELKLQEQSAKTISQENTLLNQQNELKRYILELERIDKEFQDKLSKSSADQQSALSDKWTSYGDASKLKNALGNFSQRQKWYYIIAPQRGYITKTIKKGLGEIIKEGSDIATIMPDQYDLAVEIYVKPMDLPLVREGNRVYLRFDGWPAIIISGWPEASTGIFIGQVVAIDRFISENGYFRILISPEESVKKWPVHLRVGAGVSSFLLLNDVPIWYEWWRQLNGFPPDYYDISKTPNIIENNKAPLKLVK